MCTHILNVVVCCFHSCNFIRLIRTLFPFSLKGSTITPHNLPNTRCGRISLSLSRLPHSQILNQMIIEKVTTQNSGVRINLNMFWMQIEINYHSPKEMKERERERSTLSSCMHANGPNEGNAFVAIARASQTYYPWCFGSIFTFFLLVGNCFCYCCCCCCRWHWHIFCVLFVLLVYLAIGDAILETVFKVNGNKRPIELGRLNLFAYRHTRPTDLIELKWILWAEIGEQQLIEKLVCHFYDNRSVRVSINAPFFATNFEPEILSPESLDFVCAIIIKKNCWLHFSNNWACFYLLVVVWIY